LAIEYTIGTLLKTLVSNRAYPLKAPLNVVKPYITFQVVSNVPEVALDGPIGTENRRVQIDAWDDDYPGVKTLEASIKAAMIAATFVNVPLNSMDLDDPETGLYRVTMDYSIWTP